MYFTVNLQDLCYKNGVCVPTTRHCTGSSVAKANRF